MNDTSSGSLDKSFTISIGDAEENAPPVIDNLTGKSIIYQPGDYWGDAYVSENQTEVATISANDPDGDTISFSLITDGYPDSQWLSIDSTSGKITFKQAPDFEDPQDAGSDNSYQIKVKASDGTLEDTLFLTIFVQNVIEKPIDNDAPLPLALTFLSREVWVGGDQDFSLLELQPSLRVQDDVSGFASGSIRWSVDGGAYASVTFSGANPSSGNANLGTFLAMEGSSISRYTNEQEAILTYIYLIDNDGNSSITTVPNLQNLGLIWRSLA